MKILKYILLILLLCFVSFSVFIVTQKGTFNVERNVLIHASKINTFNYVNDYQNWEDFITFLGKETILNSQFSKKSNNKNSRFTWESGGESGLAQTITLKKYESISQKMVIDGTEFTTTWIFKDTLGGTKVTLKSKGEMSFSNKIYAALHGGTSEVIGVLYDKSLTNLDKNLDYEINTYKIKTYGLVQKFGTPYLKQTFTSKISLITKNSRIVFPKLLTFCEQNNIDLNGKPFIIYHTYDDKSGVAKISLCLPIKTSILTSEGSDILADKLEPFKAIKTTLYGDYSHSGEVIKKSKAYINQKVITPSSKFSHIEVYTISKKDIKYPSKWRTDNYFPIQTKRIVTISKPITEESAHTETNDVTSKI